MQQLVALTGFDPRRDVRELLVASDGVPQGKTGLALASGNFDAAKITAAATLHGVVTEREADDLVREAETFLALVARSLGVAHQPALDGDRSCSDMPMRTTPVRTAS